MMDPHHGGPSIQCRRPGRAIRRQGHVDTEPAATALENDEYASFIRRVMRAHAWRVAAGDVDALADIAGLATELDEAIIQAVTRLRNAGYSWAEIATRLGVTRQAAHSAGATGRNAAGASTGDHLGTTRYERGRTSRM